MHTAFSFVHNEQKIFFAKNRNYGIFSIVTTSGESAPGQQWQIDIGSCTVRTRARRQRTISPCVYMITICMLMGLQGSEGTDADNTGCESICILMRLQNYNG